MTPKKVQYLKFNIQRQLGRTDGSKKRKQINKISDYSLATAKSLYLKRLLSTLLVLLVVVMI